MRTLLLLPLLLMSVPPAQDGARTDNGSSVVVTSFKYSKSRQTTETPDTADTAPAAAMISTNKNYERGRRANTSAGVANVPAGVSNPSGDTVDSRSAELERNVRESRAPRRKAVDGFAYRVKVRNAGAKVIEVLFWEYQFTETANPANVARRQFLCGVNIKPDKEKELQAFSPSGPGAVISVGSLSDKTGNLSQEKVVINRVEYADGSIWQRKDWNFAEVKLSIERATKTPWGAEMCRGL